MLSLAIRVMGDSQLHNKTFDPTVSSILELEVPSTGPYKIRVPISVTHLNWTPWFDYGYQTYLCLKETGLYAQNIITIVGLKITIVGGLYATRTWAGESRHLSANIWAQNIRATACVLTILHKLHVSYPRWCQQSFKTHLRWETKIRHPQTQKL